MLRTKICKPDWRRQKNRCVLSVPVRWIRIAGGHQHEKDGQIRKIAGIVRDITEQKLAVQALRETETLQQHSAIARVARIQFELFFFAPG